MHERYRLPAVRTTPIFPARIDTALPRWSEMMDVHSIAGTAFPATDAGALERLERFGGGNLLRQMIALFLSAAPERIEAARGAGARGDVAAAELALHSLKASSAQLGALRMQRLSEQGELSVRDGSLDGLAELTRQLDEELVRVHEWLARASEEAAT
jgi:HPt (histidine-containing phosphotransfer) domain-containing protein